MRWLAIMMLCLTPCTAMAASNPAETVPFDHWAYDALQKLVDPASRAGAHVELQGEHTRYEWAMALVRLFQSTLSLPAEKEDEIARLWGELIRLYRPELELLDAGGEYRIRRVLAALPEDHWFYSEAQAILTEFREPATEVASDQFPDVREGHWAYHAVLKLKRAGILIGYPPGGGEGPVFGDNTDEPTKPTDPAETVPFD